MTQPPFQITNTIIENIEEIAELIGRLSHYDRLLVSPMLRRENRIRSIYGSLAIEQNTLTLEGHCGHQRRARSCAAEGHRRGQKYL